MKSPLGENKQGQNKETRNHLVASIINFNKEKQQGSQVVNRFPFFFSFFGYFFVIFYIFFQHFFALRTYTSVHIISIYSYIHNEYVYIPVML